MKIQADTKIFVVTYQQDCDGPSFWSRYQFDSEEEFASWQHDWVHGLDGMGWINRVTEEEYDAFYD